MYGVTSEWPAVLHGFSLNPLWPLKSDTQMEVRETILDSRGKVPELCDPNQWSDAGSYVWELYPELPRDRVSDLPSPLTGEQQGNEQYVVVCLLSNHWNNSYTSTQRWCHLWKLQGNQWWVFRYNLVIFFWNIESRYAAHCCMFFFLPCWVDGEVVEHVNQTWCKSARDVLYQGRQECWKELFIWNCVWAKVYDSCQKRKTAN